MGGRLLHQVEQDDLDAVVTGVADPLPEHGRAPDVEDPDRSGQSLHELAEPGEAALPEAVGRRPRAAAVGEAAEAAGHRAADAVTRGPRSGWAPARRARRRRAGRPPARAGP